MTGDVTRAIVLVSHEDRKAAIATRIASAVGSFSTWGRCEPAEMARCISTCRSRWCWPTACRTSETSRCDPSAELEATAGVARRHTHPTRHQLPPGIATCWRAPARGHRLPGPTNQAANSGVVRRSCREPGEGDRVPAPGRAGHRRPGQVPPARRAVVVAAIKVSSPARLGTAPLASRVAIPRTHPAHTHSGRATRSGRAPNGGLKLRHVARELQVACGPDGPKTAWFIDDGAGPPDRGVPPAAPKSAALVRGEREPVHRVGKSWATFCRWSESPVIAIAATSARGQRAAAPARRLRAPSRESAAGSLCPGRPSRGTRPPGQLDGGAEQRMAPPSSSPRWDSSGLPGAASGGVVGGASGSRGARTQIARWR
jgi:hypothetical protein